MIKNKFTNKLNNYKLVKGGLQYIKTLNVKGFNRENIFNALLISISNRNSNNFLCTL